MTLTQLSQEYKIALHCQRDNPDRVVATFAPQGSRSEFILASSDAGQSLDWSGTKDDPGDCRDEIENELCKRLQLRATWQSRVEALTRQIQNWSEADGWATKRVPIFLESRLLGPHQTTMLYLQKDRCRMQVEPISRLHRREQEDLWISICCLHWMILRACIFTMTPGRFIICLTKLPT